MRSRSGEGASIAAVLTTQWYVIQVLQLHLLADCYSLGCLVSTLRAVSRQCPEILTLWDLLQVLVHSFEEPALAAWHGGSELAASPQFGTRLVTKAQYQEWGPREV